MFRGHLLPFTPAAGWRLLTSKRFSATAKARSFRATTGASSSAPSGGQANPYKSWDHMSHKWMILMCFGCLGAGGLAGRYAKVDEEKLNIARFEKQQIVDEMQKNFEVRPDLAPTLIRVAFVLAARRAGVGAETADESCATVDGLRDVAGIMQFSSMGSDCTMEDMVALGAVEAVRFLRGPCAGIEWQWGRMDGESKPRLQRTTAPKTTEDVAPRGMAASPRELHNPTAAKENTLNPLLPFEVVFKAMDPTFTDAEMVALMGAHAVGETHDHVTGVAELQRSPTPFLLDNSYFKTLLACEKKLCPLQIPRSKENEDVSFLSKDFRTATIDSKLIAKDRKNKRIRCGFAGREATILLGNKTYRTWVQRFADDKTAWEAEFERAFQKVIDSNVTGKLRPYQSPSAKN